LQNTLFQDTCDGIPKSVTSYSDTHCFKIAEG
jgi:hypothetical protein